MKRASFVAVVVAAISISGATASATGSRAVLKTVFNPTLKTKILVDGSGRTVYMLTSDTNGKPTCAQLAPDCPKVWPAFATTGKPKAGRGITASKLSTVKGAGGVTQVVYNHHPLYYFAGGHSSGKAGDKKPGDIRGQGFFGIWYVLSPGGKPIKK
jgi:predicted lipoprotein with Yx(FWY)xxD motif